MSSSELDPEMTVIKSKVIVQQTEVTAPKSQLEGEFKELGADLGKVGKGALKGTLNSLGGFRTFILRGNVVDLAIGIVIGAAFTTLVTSMVGDVITPLIPLPGKNSLGDFNIPLLSPPYPKGTDIHVGLFINAIISFLIVAAVLYFFVVQPVNRLTQLYHPKEVEAKKTHDCPYCFQPVHIDATRCPFCTSHLTAIPEKPEEKEDPILILPDTLEKLSDQLAEKIARKATSKLEKMGEISGGSATAKE
jgi:large conductance mechanosensitive channel